METLRELRKELILLPSMREREREKERREGEKERRERGERGENQWSTHSRMEGWRVSTVKMRQGEKEIGETEYIVLASVVQPRQAPDPNEVKEGNEVRKWMRDAAM